MTEHKNYQSKQNSKTSHRLTLVLLVTSICLFNEEKNSNSDWVTKFSIKIKYFKKLKKHHLNYLTGSTKTINIFLGGKFFECQFIQENKNIFFW